MLSQAFEEKDHGEDVVPLNSSKAFVAKVSAVCRNLCQEIPSFKKVNYIQNLCKYTGLKENELTEESIHQLCVRTQSNPSLLENKISCLLNIDDLSQDIQDDLNTSLSSTPLVHAVENWRKVCDPVTTEVEAFEGVLDSWREYAPDFNWNILDISSCNGSEFTSAVASACIQTFASRHQYLERLERGELPSPMLAVQSLFRNYKEYSSNFVGCIQSISTKISCEEHLSLLLDNQEEENGHMDDETAHELQKAYGIDPKDVQGIPHKVLFSRLADAIEAKTAKVIRSKRMENTSPGQWFANRMSALYKGPFPSVCYHSDRAEEARLQASFMLGAFGPGTESIVKYIYRYIFNAVKTFYDLEPREYAFLPLHMDLDDDHAAALCAIGSDLVGASRRARLCFLLGAASAIKNRIGFWDRLLAEELKYPDQKPSIETKISEINVPQPRDSLEATANATSTASLYDKQSDRWVRDSPNVLSDFTGREAIFELCAPVKGLRVLDIGCGEGYCTRRIKREGAAEVIASDISAQMIERARETEAKQNLGNLQFYVADARTLVHSLKRLQVKDVEKGFDLVTAVFVFNYVSLHDMKLIMNQVRQVLKPGGRFVFSVPHPSLKFWNRPNMNDELEGKPFFFENKSSKPHKGYFNTDTIAEGRIWTRDGKILNVRSFHKTLTDYIHSMQECGLLLEEMRELSVTDKLNEMDPEFFGPLHEVPLHIGFACTPRKVSSPAKSLANGLLWPKMCTSEEDFILRWTDEALLELSNVANLMKREGMTAQMYQIGLFGELPGFSELGKLARHQIENFGAVILPGERLEELSDETLLLAYTLLCAHTGYSFFTDRGRIHLVKDLGLSSKDGDVLFSLTNEKSGWHTDSTRKDVFPDIVGLQCIHPSADNVGGSLKLTSAVAAWNVLQSMLPKFLLDELTRPVIRDLVEAGKGGNTKIYDMKNRREKALRKLEETARDPTILGERIKANAFPIFEFSDGGALGNVKCRYMRSWIESGHQRANVPLSPLLTIAMDVLDHVLETKTFVMQRRLKRGEIALISNHSVLHDRTSFSDLPNHPKREQARIWMKAN